MLAGKKLWLIVIVLVIFSLVLLQPALAEENPVVVEEVEILADPPEWGLSGHDLIFTAQVTAGNEDAEFAFYYKLPGGSWTLGRSYDTDPTWLVNTGYSGEVEIGVIARAVGSDAFDEARKSIDYKIHAVYPVIEVGLRANPPNRQAPGETVIFSAEVWDGNENAEFAFYYKLPGGKWTLGRPYSTNHTWEASTSYVGDVEIGVIARAVGSDASYEAQRSIDYTMTEDVYPMANVSGRAVDVESGEPVADAHVDFWNLHGHYEAGYVQTDSDGYFSLDVPVEPGENDYHIWFHREGYIHFALEVTVTEDVIFDPVDFYPEEMGATVTGEITDADSGALLDDVWVDARLTGTDYFFNFASEHHQVNGDGNYELLIPEGIYNLNFHSDGYLDYRKTVTVEAGEILILDVELHTFGAQFSVNPRWDNMWGHGWLENSELTLTIGDPGSPEWTGSFETDKDGNFYFSVDGEHNIQVGDLLTISDGVSTSSLEVEQLIITDVDFDNNLVYGRASPGRADIEVSVHPEGDWDNQTFVYTDADQEGYFIADFSGIINFDESYNVEAIVFNDRGNGTYTSWLETLYRISVAPSIDHLSLHAWQSEESIDINIVGGDGFSTSIEADTWGEVRLDLAGLFAIEAGYEITATQGDHTETYTVTELELTEVDYEANTVSGTAAPGSLIVVLSDEEMHEVSADQGGSWVAQFDSINQGDTGYAIEYEGEIFRSSNTYLRWP